MSNTTIYAKVRRLQDLTHHGKPRWKYALEIREIAPDSGIESEVLEPKFDSKQDAEEWAKSKNFTLTRTWGEAERQQGVYRDGSLNIYRVATAVRGYTAGYDTPEQNAAEQKHWEDVLVNKKPTTDTSDAEDQAWQEALAKMESAKAKRVERVDLI